jgi:hypothetical protein
MNRLVYEGTNNMSKIKNNLWNAINNMNLTLAADILAKCAASRSAKVRKLGADMLLELHDYADLGGRCIGDTLSGELLSRAQAA